MKAQANMLEYVFLTFFVIVVIVGLIFFLSGWTALQLNMDKEKTKLDSALFLAKQFQNLPVLVHDRSMFDDSKLTAMASLGPADSCKYLEAFMDQKWFAEVAAFDGSGSQVNCTYSNYPNCNFWSFCDQPRKKTTTYLFPVNIYRKFGLQTANNVFPKVELGTLKIGVYE
jgi:hypothetical protein